MSESLITDIEINLPGILVGPVENGGYFVHPQLLPERPVVYCGGLGHQIEFELGLIATVSCVIYGFDPTPESARFLRRFRPQNFVFANVALTGTDSVVFAKLNKEPSAFYRSISIEMVKSDDIRGVRMELKGCRVPSLMHHFGHDRIDLLKIDIEGAEYSVIGDLLDSDVLPGQITLEWHPGQTLSTGEVVGIGGTNAIMSRMHMAGYRRTYVGARLTEMSFVHMSAVHVAR
jgi:FkbM family methyltransferase